MSSTNPDGTSLVLNVGSSSIKFKIYSSASTPFLRGSVSPVGGDAATRPKMSIALSHGEVSAERILPAALDYRALVNVILSELVALPVVRDVVGEHWSRLELVAHRTVHGGEATEGKVVKGETEEEVLEWCREVEQLAPLHNHLALQVVQACRSTLPSVPSVPSVLLFDTLFHQTIPKHITTYPISHNPSCYSGAPIRRYGFHGLSYASVLNTMSKQLNKSEDDCNLVVAHLGSGGSVCMIRGGKSMETSMGLTPLEGLMGGTRSGSVDPSIAFHLLGREAGEMVDWNGLEISRGELLLNKESGFLGMTGTSDFKVILDRAFNLFDPPTTEQFNALLAYNAYLHSLTSVISSYLSQLFASLPSESSIQLVFSGGIGENAPPLRKDVLASLSWIEKLGGGEGGVDDSLHGRSGTRMITTGRRKVEGWVVETDEEEVMDRMARELVG